MDKDYQNTVEEKAAGAADASAPESARRSPLWLVAAVAGLLLTVAAWCALMFYPVASFWCGLAGIVLSVAGLRVGRCCWRDIAITSIVASVVLVLVHIIFTWGLEYTVNNL